MHRGQKQHRRMVPPVVLTLAGALVLACAVLACAPLGRGPAPVERKPEPHTVQAASASAELVEEARRARKAGDLERARVLLTRAQRIAPRDAGVYLEYALLHLAEGAEEPARAMAQRGLLYCRERRTCKRLQSLL